MAIRNIESFRIEVIPSPGSNDHQVRFLADGEDLLKDYWPSMIGLDPDSILREPCKLIATEDTHEAKIARCDCGEIGCGNVKVDISLEDDIVKWEPENLAGVSDILSLRFPTAIYHAEVQRALLDTSWETPDRTAARLVRVGIRPDLLAANGLTFEWASGRVQKNGFTISLRLEPGPYQLLLHRAWSGESPQQIAESVLALLATDPKSWTYVEWYPQTQGLKEPPAISGRGWKIGKHF